MLQGDPAHKIDIVQPQILRHPAHVRRARSITADDKAYIWTMAQEIGGLHNDLRAVHWQECAIVKDPHVFAALFARPYAVLSWKGEQCFVTADIYHLEFALRNSQLSAKYCA